MPRRSAKNLSVGYGPWTGPWRDAPLPRPRSSGTTVALSGGPSRTLAARLWRLAGLQLPERLNASAQSLERVAKRGPCPKPSGV